MRSASSSGLAPNASFLDDDDLVLEHREPALFGGLFEVALVRSLFNESQSDA